MKAVQFARFDGPDALEVVDVPNPIRTTIKCWFG